MSYKIVLDVLCRGGKLSARSPEKRKPQLCLGRRQRRSSKLWTVLAAPKRAERIEQILPFVNAQMETSTGGNRPFEKRTERVWVQVPPSFMEFVQTLHAENILNKMQVAACHRLALRMGYASLAALSDKSPGALALLLEGRK